MDIKLPNEYAIKFNAEFVPIDFDKWTKLDIDYEKNKVIVLNDYAKQVVIKSKEKYILLNLGINYMIEQNWIYFPFLPLHHNIILTLSPNIEIYSNPNSNYIFEFNKIMAINNIIFYNMKIIDNETNNQINSDTYLLGTDGIIALTRKKYIDIDIENFYYEYEKENNENNIDEEITRNNINLIDKYYQFDAIKICKFI